MSILVQFKGKESGVIPVEKFVWHLLMKEALRTFKAATATWNKKARIFCLLRELKGRFLISRPSSSYVAVHDSICGHWITFTVLSNHSLHMQSYKWHYTFLGGDGRTCLSSLTPPWLCSMASPFWFEKRVNPPSSLIKRKIPDLLKKKKKEGKKRKQQLSGS